MPGPPFGPSYHITTTSPSFSYYTLNGSDRNGSVTGNNSTVTCYVGDTLNFYVPQTSAELDDTLYNFFFGQKNPKFLVVKLNQKYNDEIEKIPSVNKMINHKYFCSLLVGKDQDILCEKYADDFNKNTPQTIMSITKMFINLFIGELVEKKIIELNKKVSEYLPNIGSGYASATIQDVLDMNIQNAYSEDYTDPYTSSFLHEPVCGWRPVSYTHLRAHET